MQSTFIVLPFIALILCGVGGMAGCLLSKVTKTEKSILKYSGFVFWIILLCMQVFVLFFVMFAFKFHVLKGLTLHHAISSYGSIGYKLWFWAVVALCIYFILSNFVAMFALDENDLTDGSKK